MKPPLALALPLLAAASPLHAGERVLFDFQPGSDHSALVATDATLAISSVNSRSALEVSTGIAKQWPGVELPSPQGHWDLSPFGEIALDALNTGPNRVELHARVDNPGADGSAHCVNATLALEPGQSGTLRVRLKRSADSTLDGKLFGMRGYPVATGGKGTVDPAKITRILVFVAKPKTEHRFEIDKVRAEGTWQAPTASVDDAAPFFPFIDTFGQYKHRDWPGKVKSLDDLRQRRETEAAELAAHPGPAGWNRFGGWAKGPQLEATGFFRTAKLGDKWWLVDPDGRLFFSHGIDCVRMIDTTPVDQRESWFDDFPGKQPEFAEFLSNAYALKGHYAGRRPRCFSFAAANMKRKYGPAWREAYAETAHRRLRSWGLNTIANWSDSSVFLLRRTPYTDTIGSRDAKTIEGSSGYWAKFPDVFDPGFAAGLKRAMEEKRRTSANDPWCIGYFSDNEMSWGDDTSLALAALVSPPDQAAKQAFLAGLRAKYGAVEKLNRAWGTGHATWDALAAARTPPDKQRALPDLAAFNTRVAETYFRTVRDTIKAVAPKQLYLGCRFAWTNDRADLAAGKFCDVISYNLYRRNVAGFRNASSDKPLIIGEFHFGALDRGMFHTGLVPVATQAERAAAYRQYVIEALRHPQFVGTHWFQWKDEPTTGRIHDEENYQIGFLDVADTPYPETIAAARAVGDMLYPAGTNRNQPP